MQKKVSFLILSFILLASRFLFPMNCPICLVELLVDGETVSILPCGHPYHTHCLEQVLISDGKCSICREEHSMNAIGNRFTPAACRVFVNNMFEGQAGGAGLALQEGAHGGGEQGGEEFNLIEYHAFGARHGVQEAMDSLLQAANAEEPSAEYYLGRCLADGAGVEQDINGAIELFTAALNKGFGLALRALESLARDGNAQAQFNLGDTHEHGIGGVEIDHATAITWYRMAANQGDPAAKAALKRLEKKTWCVVL